MIWVWGTHNNLLGGTISRYHVSIIVWCILPVEWEEYLDQLCVLSLCCNPVFSKYHDIPFCLWSSLPRLDPAYISSSLLSLSGGSPNNACSSVLVECRDSSDYGFLWPGWKVTVVLTRDRSCMGVLRGFTNSQRHNPGVVSLCRHSWNNLDVVLSRCSL